jgi:hypothetical protein
VQTRTAFRLSAISLVLGTLVACGGGGSSSTSSSTLSGKVIDGYIVGARVCLDVNSNNKCDAGEPTTISDGTGSYVLPNYIGSLAGLQVVAEVIAGAIDLDDGIPIPANATYTLMAPAAASSTVTPLSTLISSAISAGGGEAAVSIEQAKNQIASETGIPVANLLAHDYKQKNDITTAQIATVTAKAIAAVTNELATNTSIMAAGLNAGEIAKAAVTAVKQTVLPRLIANGRATDAAINNAQTAVTAAVAGASISGQVQNIIVATKAGNGSVVQLRDIFEQGIVIAQESSGDYINSAGTRVNGSFGGYTTELDVEYLKTTNGRFPPYKQLVYLQTENKWFDVYEGGSNWTFNGNGWEKMPGQGEALPDSLQPTYEQNCVIVPENRARTVNSRYCAVQKDLSNRRIADFIQGVQTNQGMQSYCYGNPRKLSSCENAVFPAGSYGYDLTQSTESTISGPYPGRFQVWVSNDNWTGYCTRLNAQSCASNDATIFDFIEWSSAGSGNNYNYQFIGDSCNTPFRIASYNPTARTGTINWSRNNGSCNSPNVSSTVETSNFEVINAGGKDVFIVPTPAIFRANNPSSNEPFRIFTVLTKDNGITGVWSGSYYPVNFKNSIPFTGDIQTNSQIMNRAAFDEILRQIGYDPYPYTGRSSSGP